MDIQVGDKVRVKASDSHCFDDGSVGVVIEVYGEVAGTPDGYVEYEVAVDNTHQLLIPEEMEKIVE